MSAKSTQVIQLPNLRDDARLFVPGSGIKMDLKAPVVKDLLFTLSSQALAVLQANDYGSFKLCDLPDSNLLLLSCEVNMTIVKGGVTNGLVAATDLDMAIGTAAASNATLSGTMLNVMEKADVDTDALSVTWQAHSSDQLTAVFPLKIADAPSQALYVNCAAAITANDSLALSGTIRIRYIDLGNDGS